MKLSLFIPVFNRRDELQRTLRALIPEKDGHEVFVVDLGSTDGSQDLVKEYPWAQLIISQQPLRSKALNQAVATATGEVLLFLEPGALPARGWSAALEKHFATGFGAGHFNCREVDTSAGWAAAIRAQILKTGHQLLGGPTGLNGVAVSKVAFDKVSGFRPVPDFEWLAFSARLRESGVTIKPLKHDLLISPAAGSRQLNEWHELKEDLLAAMKYRKSSNFDSKRIRRKASSAVLFGYDCFPSPQNGDYFKQAQQALMKISLEVMQSYRGVEKIYFIGGPESCELIGQPSGVELFGKAKTGADKRLTELLVKLQAEQQEGLLLVRPVSLTLSHATLRQLSEGPGVEPCIVLPETDSNEWVAIWLQSPAIEALADWELHPELSALQAHLKGKLIRQEVEKPVKGLRSDSDARGMYYAGMMEQQPA